MDVDAHEPVHCNKYAGIYACTCVHVQTFVPCTSCLYVYIYIYIHCILWVCACRCLTHMYTYIETPVHTKRGDRVELG